MFGLLIVIAAAAFGAVAAVILLVAWAVRREDAYLTMADPPAGPLTLAVRRLLGLHAKGITGPARPGTTATTREEPGPVPRTSGRIAPV